MHRMLFALTMVLLLACSAGEVLAYTLMSCGSTNLKWASNVYATSASGSGFPTGPWRDALASVVSRWNNNPSLLGYSISYGDTSFGLGNGQSEVWWSSNFGAPTVANWWINMSTCRFTEVDVRFDNTVAYHYTTSKSSLLPYDGSSRPFQTTAIHEFGHAGGLLHTPNTYSIMGQDWTHIHTNGSTARAYPGEDASAGVVALYGVWSSGPEDVGVVHWRWTGSSGGYSTHCRTRIFNSSGVLLPLFSGVSCWGAEPIYRVSKGQTVQLELSYESLGKSSKTVAVGYYLSTDSTINTADRFLSSTSITFSRNTVLTWKKTLTIPTNLASNTTYYLGAVVDYTGALSELSETNNATYIGIRVQ
jgi:hypothetical protein